MSDKKEVPPASVPSTSTDSLHKGSKSDHNKTPWWVTRDMADHFNREAVLVTTLRASLVFALYFIAITLCTIYRRHPMMFFFSQALKGQFIDTEFKTINDQSIKFADIRSTADFWKYTQTLLLDSLFWDHTYSDENMPLRDPDDRTILHENHLLGVARIRQAQVRNDSCVVHEYFRLLFLGCYDMFLGIDENHDAFGKKSGTAWVYSDASQTKSLPFTGDIATYEGGGYYQDLARTKNQSLAIVRDLFENLWITRGTRVIFIDFTVYNANMDLFCVCKLVFEFPPTGGILPSTRFQVTYLDVGFHSSNKVAFASECVIYLLGIIYLFEELREMWYFGFSYFKQFWSYMDLLVIVLIVANLVTSVILFPNVNVIINDIVDHPNAYGNLEYVASLKSLNNVICALLIFVSCIKLFKYLNFNRTMGQLNSTLHNCVYDIACFTVMFLLIFCAYAELGYLLFGHQVLDYSSFGTAMITLLRAILGDFDYEAIEQMNNVLAPLYFLSYIFFVFFVLLNMFLAIINDTYTDVKTEIALAPKELQLTEYIQNRIIKQLRRWGFRVSGKRESKIVLHNIRQSLKKCGFTEKEIQLFFDRLDPDKHGDNNKILKELESQISAMSKVDDEILLQLGDFLAREERIEQIQNNVLKLLEKTEEPLTRLRRMENEPQ